MSEDQSKASYWNDLYLKGEAGWDKGLVSPPIARLLREGGLGPGAAIAVVGAGRGYEARDAAALGFSVTAIDFAEEAAKALRAAAQAGPSFAVEQRDLFDLPRTHAGRFDAVLEHTCFCAIPVARRDEYVETAAQLLKPRGVLFGLFYAHGRPGGPPFDTSEEEVRRRFEPRFEVTRLARAPDSFEIRRGAELEAWFIKRDAP